MRAFVRMRRLMEMNTAMAEKLAELERRVTGHDEAIRSLVRTIRELMSPAAPRRRPIGFRVEEAGASYRIRRRRTRSW